MNTTTVSDSLVDALGNVSSRSGEPSRCEDEHDEEDTIPENPQRQSGHYTSFLVEFLLKSPLAFGSFYRASLNTGRQGCATGQRDLLPLPLWVSTDGRDLLATVVNLMIVGLNFLHAGCCYDASCLPPLGEGTLSQCTAITSLDQKSARLMERLECHQQGQDAAMTPQQTRDSFLSMAGYDYPQLVADHVDLPDHAGSCDPLRRISPEQAAR